MDPDTSHCVNNYINRLSSELYFKMAFLDSTSSQKVQKYQFYNYVRGEKKQHL